MVTATAVVPSGIVVFPAVARAITAVVAAAVVVVVAACRAVAGIAQGKTYFAGSS